MASSPRPPRRGRLSRSAEFERAYRQGRSNGNRFLVLYAFPRGDEEPARLGLSVSRKVGGAVDRNRVKRLVRESFQLHVPKLRAGYDFVVVARPDARELAERSGLSGIAEALGELLSLASAREEERAA